MTSLLNLYTSSINQTGIENKIFIKNAPNTVFGSSIFFRKSTADIIFKDIEKNKILLPNYI